MATVTPLINRVYHPYWKWEESQTNMWRTVDNRDELLAEAIRFTGLAGEYGKGMMRVVDEWPISCEHNLSNITQNRKAWIGHAACAIVFNCPEDIVREAWGKLTELQQRAANAVADTAIETWETRYAKERLGNKRAGSCERTHSLDF